MVKLPIQLARNQLLLRNLGVYGKTNVVICQMPMQSSSQVSNINHIKMSREFSTSSSLCKTLQQLTLSKSRVNMQKTKHIQFSSDYIQKKVVEYNLGRRRLAIIMGKDPESFAQDDVDEAIEYLFPTDLDKEVAAKFKHPTEVFPAKTVTKVDEHGRPLDSFFYTLDSDYNALMHEIYEKRLQLQMSHAESVLKMSADKSADKKDESDGDDTSFEVFRGTVLLNKEEVEAKFFGGSELTETQFHNLHGQLLRLFHEPSIHTISDYVMKFRKEIIKQEVEEDIPVPQLDHDGRHFVEAEGEHKSSKAKVKVIYPGNGKITVNGKDFGNFFFALRSREIVIAPFSLLGYNRLFDVVAQVDYPLQLSWNKRKRVANEYEREKSANTNNTSRTGHARAMRLAISLALKSFVTSYRIETLRQAGLLSFDIRAKERKMPGFRKARKRPTWKKR